MKICPTCQKEYDNDARYCPLCGVPLESKDSVPVSTPTPTYEQTPVQPVRSRSAKVKAIVGTSVSGFGLIYSAIGTLYSWIPFSGIIIAIIFGFISTPTAIAGLILTKQAVAGGVSNGLTKAGKILPWISLLCTVLMFIVGVISLITCIALGIYS